jgi:hypothetical protein
VASYKKLIFYVIPEQISLNKLGLYCPAEVLISDLLITLQITSGKMNSVKARMLRSKIPITIKSPIDDFIFVKPKNNHCLFSRGTYSQPEGPQYLPTYTAFGL